MIKKTLNNLTPDEMEAEYPVFFDEPKTSVSYVLIKLLAHLNYHLGQINYLRRIGMINYYQLHYLYYSLQSNSLGNI